MKKIIIALLIAITIGQAKAQEYCLTLPSDPEVRADLFEAVALRNGYKEGDIAEFVRQVVIDYLLNEVSQYKIDNTIRQARQQALSEVEGLEGLIQ